MARGIYDVDFYAVVHNSCVLGQNRDAALTLDIAGVHNALCNLLVGAEHMALLQHAINQGRLTMVNVGDNGDVSQIFIGRHTHFSVICLLIL